MVLVKILGGIDLIVAFTLLAIIFGATPPTTLLLFSAGLLLVKGLFIFTGDVLSLVDIFSSVILFISIFFTPFSILLWSSTTK